MKFIEDGVPAKYRPLLDFLLEAPPTEVVLPIADVESILNFGLPGPAHDDPFWWRSIPRNSWARSWLRADRIATLNSEDGTVTFTPGVYSPPVDHQWMIAQRHREATYARECLSSRPMDIHLRDRWWEPHLVYILHIHAEGFYKVGVTRHDARRLRDLTARGRAGVEASSMLANRHAARLVEIAVLDATDSARRVADRYNHHNGQTEHWDDSVPPPALEPIAAAFALDECLPNWALSLNSKGVEDVH
ncbi:hypothetical protein QCD70_16140 [Agreia sp. PsM10]|uniref:hypothetical protein n=1 Tax=Agreia sp. PsM10 TaxID=3030533 RepID=UPI00263AE456|nr:hypothetical protein [Agreia sp. PsM10]MDN4641782.1 hypothetical protein [Agreia sp. PsM10]